MVHSTSTAVPIIVYIAEWYNRYLYILSYIYLAVFKNSNIISVNKSKFKVCTLTWLCLWIVMGTIPNLYREGIMLYIFIYPLLYLGTILYTYYLHRSGNRNAHLSVYTKYPWYKLPSIKNITKYATAASDG